MRRISLQLPAKPAPLPGGITVRRALPRRERRAVGPFVFFDHAGPQAFAPGAGLHVPAHPHAGLETVTWLFAGALLHKDSLGNEQVIRAGDVNWMTSGRGIVHSEESEPAFRRQGGLLHLAQLWVALPAAYRAVAPAFVHHPATTLPRVARDGLEVTLIAGEWDAHCAPVHTYSPLAALEFTLAPGARARLPWPDGWEAAVYVAEGALDVGGETVAERVLGCLDGDGAIELAAAGAARGLLFGGATLAEPRAIWGNFVLGTVEEAKRAQADFEAGRFGRVP